MKRLMLLAVALFIAFVGLVAAGNQNLGPVVITREDEQKVILLLDEARRVSKPGLSLRWPAPLGDAETFDRRWLYLNTEPDTVQTFDGENLIVDNYAIWRISDAIQFKRSFPGGMAEAGKRIDRAVRDDVREVLGRHGLTEILEGKRTQIMATIRDNTRDSLTRFGIDVADVRINRTDLPGETLHAVYGRMTTERERLAKGNRAEGDQKARKIRAEADREAIVIVAESRRDAELAKGEGDATAAGIYAEAYSKNPEFYAFVRSLEAYGKAIDDKTTLVLSPESEFFQLFESSKPGGR